MNGHLDRNDVPAAALESAQPVASGQPAGAQNKPASGKCGMNVYFSTASAELTPQAKEQLNSVASCLKREHSPDDALIVGSTDPRGSQQDNASLGEERARRVAAYLKTLGVGEGDIRIRSLGESQASAAPASYPSSRKAEIKGQ
jgi:outer membrane protein OmpA-like peptidoglycan-associated protein